MLDKKREEYSFKFSKQENIPRLMMAAAAFDVIWDRNVPHDWWTVADFL